MKKLFFSLFVLGMFYSCGPSVKITSSWVAKDAALKKYNKIMVLALAPAKYTDAGRVGEDDMVAQLKANGIEAMSAQAEYGPEKFRNLNEEDAVAKIRKSGADGVIVMSLLDAKKEKQYVPGYWTPPPYYGHFWGYYSFWYDRAYQPGYYETTKEYLFETNLYDLSDRTLVYSAESRTIDPPSVERLAKQFSKHIVDDMKAKRVL